MRTNFELIARTLIDVRRPQDVKMLNPGRQRHRAANNGARTLGGFNDFLSRLVNKTIVKGFQTNSDFLVLPAPAAATPATTFRASTCIIFVSSAPGVTFWKGEGCISGRGRRCGWSGRPCAAEKWRQRLSPMLNGLTCLIHGAMRHIL